MILRRDRLCSTTVGTLVGQEVLATVVACSSSYEKGSLLVNMDADS